MSKLDSAVKNAKVRPNLNTLKIALVAIVLGVALWFLFVSPTSARLAEATEERDRAAQETTVLENEIASFRSGESFTASQLPSAVGPAEELLPPGADITSAPGDTANAVGRLANSNGLVVDGQSFASRYSPASGELMNSTLTMTVMGSPTAISEWLSGLASFEQLVTVQTDGLTATIVDGVRMYQMTATVSIWATSTPSLLTAPEPSSAEIEEE